MIDESFHLTSLDVRRFDFGRSLRGYNPEKVEQFREQVAEEIERLGRDQSRISTRKLAAFTSSFALFASATRR